MSMASCNDCGRFIDCDEDPDACVDDKFVCEPCREQDQMERAIDKAMYDAEDRP